MSPQDHAETMCTNCHEPVARKARKCVSCGYRGEYDAKGPTALVIGSLLGLTLVGLPFAIPLLVYGFWNIKRSEMRRVQQLNPAIYTTHTCAGCGYPADPEAKKCVTCWARPTHTMNAARRWGFWLTVSLVGAPIGLPLWLWGVYRAERESYAVPVTGAVATDGGAATADRDADAGSTPPTE